MDPERIAGELRTQLRERPYWTTAAMVGVGWIVGRSLPLRVVFAVAGIGARAVMAATFEDLLDGRVGLRRTPTEESR